MMKNYVLSTSILCKVNRNGKQTETSLQFLDFEQAFFSRK